MIFAGPEITKGANCKRPVELLDIYPTLAELCDLQATPDRLEGLSLVPQLKDADAPRARPAVTSHGPGNDAVRTETHRYIRYADGSEELYDMLADPHEYTNLAGQSEHTPCAQEVTICAPAKEPNQARSRQQRTSRRAPGGRSCLLAERTHRERCKNSRL